MNLKEPCLKNTFFRDIIIINNSEEANYSSLINSMVNHFRAALLLFINFGSYFFSPGLFRYFFSSLSSIWDILFGGYYFQTCIAFKLFDWRSVLFPDKLLNSSIITSKGFPNYSSIFRSPRMYWSSSFLRSFTSLCFLFISIFNPRTSLVKFYWSDFNSSLSNLMVLLEKSIYSLKSCDYETFFV